MPCRINSTTPLSVLQRVVFDAPSHPAHIARLVRNVAQSLRVEGYPVSEGDVRASCARILDVHRSEIK